MWFDIPAGSFYEAGVFHSFWTSQEVLHEDSLHGPHILDQSFPRVKCVLPRKPHSACFLSQMHCGHISWFIFLHSFCVVCFDPRPAFQPQLVCHHLNCSRPAVPVCHGQHWVYTSPSGSESVHRAAKILGVPRHWCKPLQTFLHGKTCHESKSSNSLHKASHTIPASEADGIVWSCLQLSSQHQDLFEFVWSRNPLLFH